VVLNGTFEQSHYSCLLARKSTSFHRRKARSNSTAPLAARRARLPCPTPPSLGSIGFKRCLSTFPVVQPERA